MTAEERLELAEQVITRIRDSSMEIYHLRFEAGQFDSASRAMDEVLIWDQALMLITQDEFLTSLAKIYLKEED